MGIQRKFAVGNQPLFLPFGFHLQRHSLQSSVFPGRQVGQLHHFLLLVDYGDQRQIRNVCRRLDPEAEGRGIAAVQDRAFHRMLRVAG